MKVGERREGGYRRSDWLEHRMNQERRWRKLRRVKQESEGARERESIPSEWPEIKPHTRPVTALGTSAAQPHAGPTLLCTLTLPLDHKLLHPCTSVRL